MRQSRKTHALIVEKAKDKFSFTLLIWSTTERRVAIATDTLKIVKLGKVFLSGKSGIRGRAFDCSRRGQSFEPDFHLSFSFYFSCSLNFVDDLT